MKEWLTRSPSFEEVAAEVSDRRKGRNKVAIIIPTYMDSATLTEHVRKLGKQTFRDFDLIIIYGKDDEFIDVPAIHIREAGSNGCTAAYYAGEKKALDEGYETVILADDDAQPLSDDLVGKLARALENGADLAYPKVNYPPCLFAEHGRIIHHYGCMRAEVLRKSGLTFVPFISGGEDIELQERFVQQGHRMVNVEALAEHPKRPPLQIEEGSKIHQYQRGHLMSHIIHGRVYGAWRFALFNSVMGIGFLLLGKKLGVKFLSCMWSGSGMVFFREKQEKVLPPEPSDIGSGYIEIGLDSQIPVPYNYLEKGSGLRRRLGWFITYLSNLPKFFNKKVLFIDRNRITPDMPIMLISRKSALRYMGKEYVLSEEAGLPAIIIRSAVFALSIVPTMFWAALLVCRGSVLRRMKKIRTAGYGVRF